MQAPPGSRRPESPASNTPSPTAERSPRSKLALWSALAAFVLVLWTATSPYGIDASWRECDTQAIARNFLLDDFDPLRPRVDWRGDGDGAVECEFPLYQMLLASVLAVSGDVEWPGRAISLFSIVLAALSLHRLLAWRVGAAGALAGTLCFLTSGQAMLLGSRVAPDGLSLALALAGLATFLRYLSTGSSAALWLAVAATAGSALQKPTALQLGMLLFAWTASLAPRRLREPRLWAGFAVILAVVGAWLAHGAQLHSETGLTFGVVSGGDTKFPDLEHLLDPSLYVHLAKTTARYGISILGALAIVALAVRRRLDRTDLSLAATVALGLIGSLRYSHNVGFGAHYHAFAAIAGAYFVARAWPTNASRWLWGAALVAFVAHGAWQLDRELWMRRKVFAGSHVMDVGERLRESSSPDDLVVVWAEKPSHDPYWNRRNNYEDPRILYHARRRGWVLPSDGLSAAVLDQLFARGARFLVDSSPDRLTPRLREFLAQRGQVVKRSHTVLIYRLLPES